MRIDSRHFAFVFVWDCTSHRDSIVCLHISPTQMRNDCDATVNRTVLMYCILAAQCIHLTAFSHSLFQFPKLGIRCRHARHSAMPHICAPEPFQFIFPILSKWSAHNPRHRIFAANRSRCHPWSMWHFGDVYNFLISPRKRFDGLPQKSQTPIHSNGSASFESEQRKTVLTLCKRGENI